MKKFSRILFGAFALICSLSLAQDSDTLNTEKMWADTGLKLGAVSKLLLNSQTCMRSNVEYFGCIKAFDALLDNDSEDSASLETDESLLALKAMYARLHLQRQISVAQELGVFKIISIVKRKRQSTDKEVQVDSSTELLVMINYLKASPKYWYNLFNSSKPEIPFDALFNWIQKNRITPANESYKAGVAINVYMAMAVNAHDYIMPKATLLKMMNGGHSSYGGIGMAFSSLDGKFTVQEPTVGSPSYLAGIHARDIILSVNNKSVEGLTIDQVAALVKGPEGTTVSLSVKRGSQVLSFSIVRKRIQDNNVTWQVLTSNEKNSNTTVKIGYIKIKDFSSKSECADVAVAIKTVQSEGAQGLIVDVRGNPGGGVQQVACTVGLFVGKNKEVLEAHDDKGNLLEEPVMTSEAGAIVTVPTVTLIDGNSASASEILAGSLQDYNVSVLVGARTFGKGTMQRIGELETSDFSNMVRAKTVGRYFLPGYKTGGLHTPQLVGIIPEVEAYGKPNPTEAEKIFFREEDYSPVAFSNPSRASTPRADIVKYYNTCEKQNGVADSIYSATKDGAIEPDYQKLVGIDVAVCAIRETNSVATHLASLKK